jgi:hypothetical protein
LINSSNLARILCCSTCMGNGICIGACSPMISLRSRRTCRRCLLFPPTMVLSYTLRQGYNRARRAVIANLGLRGGTFCCAHTYLVAGGTIYGRAISDLAARRRTDICLRPGCRINCCPASGARSRFRSGTSSREGARRLGLLVNWTNAASASPVSRIC